MRAYTGPPDAAASPTHSSSYEAEQPLLDKTQHEY
jgi:hypothetical protein